MKYLIWGTGSRAREQFKLFESPFFKDNQVLAFVDNSSKKWGGFVEGIEIIEPGRVKDFSYDKIIVLSVHESEIISQIVNQLHIDKNKVLNFDGFYDELHRYYEDQYQLSKKKMLVIGDEGAYEQKEFNIHVFFNIAAFLPEDDFDKRDRLDDIEFEYALIIEKIGEYGRIYEKFLNIYKEKCAVFTQNVVDVYFHAGKKISLGKDNEDKKFLLVRGAKTSGIASMMNVATRGMILSQDEGLIPVVDMMTYKNQYISDDEVGKANGWEKFFEQPGGWSVDDISSSKNVLIKDLGRMSYDKEFYNERQSNELRKLKLSAKLKEQIDRYRKEVFDKKENVLGIVFRGTDYSNIKPYGHPVQPNLEMLISKTKEKFSEWKCKSIFLCTEVQEAVDEFEREFSEKVFYYPQRRFSMDTADFLSDVDYGGDDPEFYRGADYLTSLYILSDCDCIVAGVCSSTRMALALNGGAYRNKFIFDLGKYGISGI